MPFITSLPIFDPVREVWEILTSKSTGRAIINSLLLAIVGAIQLGIAGFACVLLWNRFMPDDVMTIPLPMQYGYGENPFALISLVNEKIKHDQVYDISLSISLPPSPVNLDKGNFMISVYYLTTETDTTRPIVDKRGVFNALNVPGATVSAKEILRRSRARDTYRQPLIIPYVDPFVALALRVLLLPLSVFRTRPESVELTTTMAERAMFSATRFGSKYPSTLLVEVEAGQDIQVYSASVTLVAQLSGLRWVVYNYWMVSFVLLTGMFWAVEIFVTMIVWVYVALAATPTLRLQDQGPVPPPGKRPWRRNSFIMSGGTWKPASKVGPRVKEEPRDKGPRWGDLPQRARTFDFADLQKMGKNFRRNAGLWWEQTLDDFMAAGGDHHFRAAGADHPFRAARGDNDDSSGDSSDTEES